MRRIYNYEHFLAVIRLREVMTIYAEKYNLTLSQFFDAFVLCDYNWEKTREYLDSIF